MSVRRLADHLRRYPVWYAVGAIWLVGMLSLPIVRGTSLADALIGDRGPGTTVTAGPSDTAPVDLGTDGSDGLGPTGGEGVGTTNGPTTATTATRGSTAPDDPLQLVPPEFLDAIFDSLPPLVLPALPKELDPLTSAVAPLATTGCSGLGLASVVIAVAAQTVDGVPLERLLPYLAPASTACASFPVPPVHTVCAMDQPLIADVGGLTTTPPILGLGVDQLRALEVVMSSQFGASIPSSADQIAQQLDCHQVS
jgi:hypothetical protein